MSKASRSGDRVAMTACPPSSTPSRKATPKRATNSSAQRATPSRRNLQTAISGGQYERADLSWGDRGAKALKRLGSKASVSADPTGPIIWNAALRECPQAEFTGMYVEFGTRPLLEVRQAAAQKLDVLPG